MKEIVKYPVTLGIICFIAGFGVFLTKIKTEPAIKQQEKIAKQSALKYVLYDSTEFRKQSIIIDGKKVSYTEGYKDGKLSGYAFIAKRSGYSSVVETMVGINPDGYLKAIKILKQAETPGLGANIEAVKSKKTILSFFLGGSKENVKEENEPYFQKQFRKKYIMKLKVNKNISISENISKATYSQEETKNHIAAITGATISSKAVTDSIRETGKKLLKAIQQDK